MNLHSLAKIVKNKKKRLGQGHGSGRVKTSGRGTKGQNARGTMPVYFEGGAQPLTKRMPFLRGKDRNKPFGLKPVIVNVDALELLPANSVVDMETLVKHKLVTTDAGKRGIKLLGNGSVNKAFKIKIPASKSAIEKITKAGGTVEV